MRIYTDDWFAAREVNGFKRRRYEQPPPVVVPEHLCAKSGVLESLDFDDGEERAFHVRGNAGVTQSAVADCIMLYNCAERAETIKHWRHRLGALISTAGYFGWEEICVLADERMRERCWGKAWARDLRVMCIGDDFDQGLVLDWFSDKLRYERLHWDMVCAWIHGRQLHEWWEIYVPTSKKVQIFERFVRHFHFNLNLYCETTPMRMIANGFMNNMIHRTELLRSFLRNHVELLCTRNGRINGLEVYTMNSMMRMCTVLQRHDYDAMIENIRASGAGVVVFRGGERVTLQATNPTVDPNALRQLEEACCPRVMERWVGLCQAVGLHPAIFATRWFALQRFYY